MPNTSRDSSTNNLLRVTVVVPCYNHGAFLAEALESVRRQTYREVECVVVDDGSTDDATRRAIDDAEASGVRVLRQTNAGLAAARNAGVRATDAPYFVPLDADDRLHPRFIEMLLPALLGDEVVGYAYSHVRFFGATEDVWACKAFDQERLLVQNLGVATGLVRRAAFEKVGGYSIDMVHGYEDWDFWIAVATNGYRGVCVPEALFEYRQHAGGSMLTGARRNREAMLRAMIDHHRAAFASTLGMELPGVSGEDTRPCHPESAGETQSVDDELYARLLARDELYHIEDARSWRLARRFFSSLSSGGVDSIERDPRVRLDRIKRSVAFRAIRALKRFSFYGRFARRRYGDAFDPLAP